MELEACEYCGSVPFEGNGAWIELHHTDCPEVN